MGYDFDFKRYNPRPPPAGSGMFGPITKVIMDVDVWNALRPDCQIRDPLRYRITRAAGSRRNGRQVMALRLMRCAA